MNAVIIVKMSGRQGQGKRTTGLHVSLADAVRQPQGSRSMHVAGSRSVFEVLSARSSLALATIRSVYVNAPPAVKVA